MADETAPKRPPAVFRFRIDTTMPTIQTASQPESHILKLWLNKSAAVDLAHYFLNVAVGIPPGPEGIGILQIPGVKMPRNAEVDVENAPDSPTQISPIVSPMGDQIVRKRD